MMTDLAPDPTWQIYDASTLQKSLILETDIAVIGTGAGGAIAAEILAAAGHKIVLIEEGPLWWTKDFHLQEGLTYANLYQECANRTTKNKDIAILQGRAVGGTTTINWTTSFRTPEPTLAHWKNFYDIDLTSTELAPWFSFIEQKLQIQPWQLPPNPNNAVLARGAKKLGWHYGVIRRNVKACVDLGYCGMGCPVGAKQSMLVTSIPAALSKGAILIHHCRAEKLQWNNKHIESVFCKALDASITRPTGITVQIKPKYVVLAGGSIGTPAVLLRSHVPDPNQLIGKRTFLHPVVISVARMPEKIEGFSGTPQSIYSDHFLWKDGIESRLGYKLEVPPMHPILVSTILPMHGEKHAKIMRAFPNLQATIALGRDGFHPESVGGTVGLYRDGSPYLDYPLSTYLWEGFRRAYLSMAELQFAAGANWIMPIHIYAAPYTTWSKARKAILHLPLESLKAIVASAHVMGGCCMGGSPKNSIVDLNGKYRYLENLSILDGSVFPTSLGANPQLSIFALAARNAAILAKQLRQ